MLKKKNFTFTSCTLTFLIIAEFSKFSAKDSIFFSYSVMFYVYLSLPCSLSLLYSWLPSALYHSSSVLSSRNTFILVSSSSQVFIFICIIRINIWVFFRVFFSQVYRLSVRATELHILTYVEATQEFFILIKYLLSSKYCLTLLFVFDAVEYLMKSCE